MEYITPEEFREWLESPTTKKVKLNIQERILEEKILLAERAGRSKDDDLFRSGLLQGMSLVANFEDLFEFKEEGKDVANRGPQGPY